MIDWGGILILLAIFIGMPVTLIIVYYYAFKSAKKRDQEMIETVIEETEDSDEEVLGRIRVLKVKFRILREVSEVHAVLVFTANSVFVKRIAEETVARAFSFTIPKSEITRVWLKKYGWKGVKLKFITSEKEYEWFANGLVLPEGWKTKVKLEDYEKILRLAFPDRLSVKK